MAVKQMAAVGAAAALLLSGCALWDTPSAETQVFAMDTVMSLTIYGSDAQTALDQAVEDLYRWDGLWDVTSENSQIWALNHNAGEAVTLDDETADLLARAVELCQLTDGALDITSYPAVQAWGFTTGEYRVPSQEELDALIPLIDYTTLTLEGTTASLPQGQMVDVGSVAKGYAGAKLADGLRQEGVESALLYLGGNVQTVGAKPDGTPWRIGIQDPAQSQQTALGVVEVTDLAVVTSGSDQRYFQQDGQTYWHIMDPSTAAPARSGVASVTVVGADGTVCDGLSTALFVLGAEEGGRFWQENPQLEMEVLWVMEDGSLQMTPGLETSFHLADGQTQREVTVLSYE